MRPSGGAFRAKINDAWQALERIAPGEPLELISKLLDSTRGMSLLSKYPGFIAADQLTAVLENIHKVHAVANDWHKRESLSLLAGMIPWKTLRQAGFQCSHQAYRN